MYVTPHKLKLENIADGLHCCVLIDDSGTPGQVAGSTYLDPSRKTWVAVVTTPKQMSEIADQVSGALEELRLQTGANEFHFTDIYRGSGAFKDTPLPLRQGIFKFMARIFGVYMFPVIMQTFGLRDLETLHFRSNLPSKHGVFNTHKPTDAALLFLLFRIKAFLRDNASEYPAPAYIVLDEGFRPADRAIEVLGCSEQFYKSSIFTASSSVFSPIQLADFAAFCISRTQWLLTKPKRSAVDDAFMRIMAPLRLNVLNLPEVSANIKTWTPQDYERFIDDDRISKSLQPKTKRHSSE